MLNQAYTKGCYDALATIEKVAGADVAGKVAEKVGLGTKLKGHADTAWKAVKNPWGGADDVAQGLRRASGSKAAPRHPEGHAEAGKRMRDDKGKKIPGEKKERDWKGLGQAAKGAGKYGLHGAGAGGLAYGGYKATED